MKKKILFVAILILVLAIPFSAFAEQESDNASSQSSFPMKPGSIGDDVVRLQYRLQELGYVNFRATGRFGDMTYAGVIDFQQRNDQTPDGIVTASVYQSVFDNTVKRNAMNPNFRRVSGPGLLATPTEFGEKSNWDEINARFAESNPVTVTDFNTRKTFEAIRVGGEGHAHIVPATKSDYDTFLSCFGGEYTWEKRPVLVEIGGTTYAASLFGMPNVEDTSDNTYIEGSLCLYFNDSTSHIAGLADSEHRVNIETASGSN